MAKPPLKEIYIAALTHSGTAAVVDGRSSKYVTLADSKDDERFYFVGKSGSLRSGRTVTESYPVDPHLKSMLKKYYTKKIAPGA